VLVLLIWVYQMLSVPLACLIGVLVIKENLLNGREKIFWAIVLLQFKIKVRQVFI
jgi:hypothetical protein